MTNNENSKRLKMDKYGTLDICSVSTTNEVYVSINYNRQVRRIRTSAIETIEAILADYNPLAGLCFVFPPNKRNISDILETHSTPDYESGVECYRKTITLIKEAEAKAEAEKEQYKAEILRRKELIRQYEALKWEILDSVASGEWKHALYMAQELKGSYRSEVRAVIIHAAREEAPIIVSVKNSRKKKEEATLRREKIKEGVRALFNI